MKISTKGRYGLSAMIDLALHYKNHPVPLKQIARRQDISEAYLEQIFATLRKSGFVKSIKGPQGGYVIAKSYSEITVLDILSALEGQLFAYESVEEGTVIEQVLQKRIWAHIKNNVEQTVGTVTLEMLVVEVLEKESKLNQMYYI